MSPVYRLYNYLSRSLTTQPVLFGHLGFQHTCQGPLHSFLPQYLLTLQSFIHDLESASRYHWSSSMSIPAICISTFQNRSSVSSVSKAVKQCDRPQGTAQWSPNVYGVLRLLKALGFGQGSWHSTSALYSKTLAVLHQVGPLLPSFEYAPFQQSYQGLVQGRRKSIFPDGELATTRACGKGCAWGRIWLLCRSFALWGVGCAQGILPSFESFAFLRSRACLALFLAIILLPPIATGLDFAILSVLWIGVFGFFAYKGGAKRSFYNPVAN